MSFRSSLVRDLFQYIKTIPPRLGYAGLSKEPRSYCYDAGQNS